MTEQESLNLYDALQHLLRNEDLGLGWLVDDTEHRVRRGAVIRSTETEEPIALLEGGRRHGLTPDRNILRQFSPKERLGLLLDALDAAVCGPVLVLHDLFERLPQARHGTIVLAADQEDSGEIIFVIEEVSDRRQAIDGLRRTMAEIRNELNAA